MTEQAKKTSSEIVNHLVASKRLTIEQVTHAERIQKKLVTAKPLLHILKDLKMISDETVNEVIRETRLSIRIGQLLVELGHLSSEDLEAAFNLQKETDPDLKLGEILEKYNFIDSTLLNKILSIQLGIPLQNPMLSNINRELLARIPLEIVSQYQFLPLASDTDQVVLAFADPQDENVMRVAKKYFGSGFQAAIGERQLLQETITLLIHEVSDSEINVDTKTVIGIVNSIILAGIKNEASDIHIEPLVDRLQIRFREDGILQHYKDFTSELVPPLISRLKIMCKADISEKRRHQGGRIFFEFSEGQVDIRVSFYVTVHGEKVVLRLLKQKQHLLDLKEIGILPNMLNHFLEDAVYQPSGVLLVTGPTGSGKTSTIYSCINHIKNPQISIITAEEPVEYVMDGIAQCAIDPQIDRTFKETLRHIVRQDPDVIVIGEIRDQDSAEMAMQSALTGHKVLSTFHTEDSIGGLIRLLNMDIAPFLISSTVVSVLAQRLLRKICPTCAVEHSPSPVQLRRMGINANDVRGVTFMKGRGCKECKQTGYRGRIGVFELLVLNEVVRNAILEQKTSHEIRELSIAHSGLITLLEDGIVKAAAGITTVEEILRCLPKLSPPRPLAELQRISGT